MHIKIEQELDIMAIKRQTNNSLSQVDRFAAFLSEWAEGYPVQTTPQHRPFSLPTGILRRRNNRTFPDDGYDNISNNGSPLPFQLHEHEEVEEQNLSRSSTDGITLESSPSGVRVVWHRESVTGTGGGNGGGVPPLPFPVTRNEHEQTAQQSSTSSSRLASSHLHLDLEHHLQGGEVPSASERSTPFPNYKRATRASRRHSYPGTSSTFPASNDATVQRQIFCVSKS